jgi:hypothetical protein
VVIFFPASAMTLLASSFAFNVMLISLLTLFYLRLILKRHRSQLAR